MTLPALRGPGGGRVHPTTPGPGAPMIGRSPKDEASSMHLPQAHPPFPNIAAGSSGGLESRLGARTRFQGRAFTPPEVQGPGGVITGGGLGDRRSGGCLLLRPGGAEWPRVLGGGASDAEGDQGHVADAGRGWGGGGGGGPFFFFPLFFSSPPGGKRVGPGLLSGGRWSARPGPGEADILVNNAGLPAECGGAGGAGDSSSYERTFHTNMLRLLL